MPQTYVRVRKFAFTCARCGKECKRQRGALLPRFCTSKCSQKYHSIYPKRV